MTEASFGAGAEDAALRFLDCDVVDAGLTALHGAQALVITLWIMQIPGIRSTSVLGESRVSLGGGRPDL